MPEPDQLDLRREARNLIYLAGLLIAVTLALLALTLPSRPYSWSYSPNGRVNAARQLTADERRILEAARLYFLANGQTLANVEFEIPVRHGDGWLVHVEYFPSAPGHHGTIEIDKDGRITRYWGGA